MSKYYYLISGLPNIALDDSKLAYSVCEFRTEQRLQALLKPITDSLVQMSIGKRVINHESRLVYFHKK